MNGTMEDMNHGDGLAATKDPSPMPSPKPMPSSSIKPEDLITRALRFLSTASTETIGGVVVGLAACTYLVLGRIGLVFIGIVGGVVLHATWEGQSSGSIEEARKEKGLDIVKRILDLRDAESKPADDEEDKELLGNSFEGFQPETALALNELVEVSLCSHSRFNPGSNKKCSADRQI
jgi:hypothetical protein